VDNLILKEVYRPITVRGGDQVLSLPALQAVVRALIARAAKGNGPAQRMLVSVVKQIEQELAAEKAEGGQIPQNIRITWAKPSDVNRDGEQPLTHEDWLKKLE
jgi:Family of unknown function (DUF5681)